MLGTVHARWDEANEGEKRALLTKYLAHSGHQYAIKKMNSEEKAAVHTDVTGCASCADLEKTLLVSTMCCKVEAVQYCSISPFPFA